MTLTVGPSLRQATVDVEIVVPVYNEQESLAASVHRLHRYLTEKFPLSWSITVADNASNDNTWGMACVPCTSSRKDGAARCERHGSKAAFWWSHIWMSSSRPISTPFCRSWPRS